VAPSASSASVVARPSSVVRAISFSEVIPAH
jgi:hypothetical protein